jgi:hypothetical protein
VARGVWAGEANGEQIIKAETLQLMYEDQYSSPRDPEPMGLGWKTARVLGSELLVWHDGGPADGTGSDGVLRIPGVVGPLIPISEAEIIIVSGPFAGEIMLYDPDTGTIAHQWVVYKPVE